MRKIISDAFFFRDSFFAAFFSTTVLFLYVRELFFAYILLHGYILWELKFAFGGIANKYFSQNSESSPSFERPKCLYASSVAILPFLERWIKPQATKYGSTASSRVSFSSFIA